MERALLMRQFAMRQFAKAPKGRLSDVAPDEARTGEAGYDSGMRLRPFLLLSVAIASTAIYACVGDDPVVTAPPGTEEAGGGDATSPGMDAAEANDTSAPIADSA